MLYIYKDRSVTLEWTIFKDRGLREDFSRASNVAFYLIGREGRELIVPTGSNAFRFALPSLCEGVYSVEAIWLKNDTKVATDLGRSVARTRVDGAFEITADTTKCKAVSSSCVVHIKSMVAIFGYDGLDAYQLAVLRGRTTLSEGAWLAETESRLNALGDRIGQEAAVRSAEDEAVNYRASQLAARVLNLEQSPLGEGEYDVDAVPTLGNVEHLITSDGVARTEAVVGERVRGMGEMKLPIPEKPAVLNVVFADGVAPQGKRDYKYAWIEYSDRDGNAFRRLAVVKAQGGSSVALSEKNMTIDFDIADYSDYYSGMATDEQEQYGTLPFVMYTDFSGIVGKNTMKNYPTQEIKFGSWVSVDKFHLKAFYADVFRGLSIVGYHYADKILRATDGRSNRAFNHTDATTVYDGEGRRSADLTEGALCMPDGFPIEVYYDGVYQGLRVWQLAKDARNYQMDKYNQDHIILDGSIGRSTDESGEGVVNNFFQPNAEGIDWSLFEVRSPKKIWVTDIYGNGDYKKLRDVDGEKYDGDNPKKLYGLTGSETSSTDNIAIKTKTSWVRDAIELFATKAAQLWQGYCDAIEGKSDAEIDEQKELFKAEFSKWYDVRGIMVYIIVSNVLYNNDGLRKNWIWTLHVERDGYGRVLRTNACPNFYDLDSIFGRHTNGTHIIDKSLSVDLINVSSRDNSSHNYMPTSHVHRFWREEINAMYEELRNKGLISVDAVVDTLREWVSRCGAEAYKKDIEKHPTLPSYRDSGVGYGWKAVEMLSYPLSSADVPYWSEGLEYGEGESVVYGKVWQGVMDVPHEIVGETDDYVVTDNNGVEAVYLKSENWAQDHKVKSWAVLARFEAEAATEVCPLTEIYDTAPYILGYHDSVKRVERWVEKRIDYLDKSVYKYEGGMRGELSQEAIAAIGEPGGGESELRVSFGVSEGETLASSAYNTQVDYHSGTTLEITLVDEVGVFGGNVTMRLRNDGGIVENVTLTPNVEKPILLQERVTRLSLTEAVPVADGTIALVVSARRDNLFGRVDRVETQRADMIARNAMIGCDMTFLFFSDLHNQKDALERIIAKGNELGVDAIVNGGDTIRSMGTAEYDWYYDAVGKADMPVLDAVGNHDAWQSGWSSVTRDFGWMSRLAVRGNLIGGMIQRGLDISLSPKGLFYYYDKKGVRFVVVTPYQPVGDVGRYWDSADVAWLEGVLSDARERGLLPICVSHVSLGIGNGEGVVDNAFHTTLWKGTGQSTINQSDGLELPRELREVLVAGGCRLMLHGHLHVDHMARCGGLLAMGIATANSGQNGCTFGGVRHTDEYRGSMVHEHGFDCYDLVGVDLDREIVKVVRYGNTLDCELRNKEYTIIRL